VIETVIETALEEEMSEHLGYDKHEPVGRNQGNSGNGKRTKTVLSDACGEVTSGVMPDRSKQLHPELNLGPFQPGDLLRITVRG
jgi:putative transposase